MGSTKHENCTIFSLLKVSACIKMFALCFHIEHFIVLIAKLPVDKNGFDDCIQDKCLP